MKDSDFMIPEEEEKKDLTLESISVEMRTLTVKEMDPDDQPRERALKYGCGVLPTADLWALVLRTGAQGKPITELCRDLMRSCDGKLFNLERMERKRFCQVKGIGETKSLQIEAVMELIRRYCRETVGNRVQIKSSADIFNEMRYDIGNLSYEEIWVLYLNRKNEIVSKEKMTQGSAVASVFDIKKILKGALLCNADALVMCHNHPSGTLKPSAQDDAITRKMREGCQTMEIRFLDHVIVTAGGYYSYQDEGRL